MTYIKIKVNKVVKLKWWELHKIKFHCLFGQLLLLWPIFLQKEIFLWFIWQWRSISLWIRVVVCLPSLFCRMWGSDIKFGQYRYFFWAYKKCICNFFVNTSIHISHILLTILLAYNVATNGERCQPKTTRWR